jgi:chromosome partitioning protein
VAAGVHELAGRLGFRFADGFAERVVYRELFPRGLSALDDLDEQTLGTHPSVAHLTARQEVEALLAALRLPIDERGRRRAEARALWLASADTPLELHDILAG